MSLRIGGLAFAILAVPALAHSGSIALPDFSSQQAGRASASVAVYSDPAAVFYNPANVARLPGLQLQLGGELVVPRYAFAPLPGDPGGKVKTKTLVTVAPWIEATYNIGDIGFGDLAVGLGGAVSYGSAVDYPSDWIYRADTIKARLAILELSPVVAWRPHRMVAVGAGFRYQPTTADIKRAVPLAPGTEGTVDLSANGHSFGASAGLGVYPVEWLSLGFSWRSETTEDFSGDTDPDFPPPFDVLAQNGKASGKIPTAQVFRWGAAFDVIPGRLNLSADIEWQLWSSYKSLSFTVVNPDGTEQQVVSPRNSVDSIVVHLGGEYRLSRAVALRAGIAFDQRTLPESTLNPAPPDSNRFPAAIGGSYYFGRVGPMQELALHANIDAAFFAERTSRTSPTRGTYSGGWPLGISGFFVGVTVSAAFDFGSRPSAFAAAQP